MPTKLEKVGRIALRQEGNFWNAYYADPDTMDGAHLLASVAMAGVQNPVHKALFMELCRGIVSDLLAEATGVKPEWNEPETAPEHERAGRG